MNTRIMNLWTNYYCLYLPTAEGSFWATLKRAGLAGGMGGVSLMDLMSPSNSFLDDPVFVDRHDVSMSVDESCVFVSVERSEG